MIAKRYLDNRFGQLHMRENGATGTVPLLCLHATAYSSLSFAALLDELEGARHAIAIDTPGYGNSDGPPEQIEIGDYAEAVAEPLLREHDLVDVLGYHTGVYLAIEMALRYPHRIRRLVLAGIPYFQAIGFDRWREQLTARHTLETDLAQFEERWDFLVTNRATGLSLERGFENFVDELRAWPHGWWTHEALFRYDSDRRLPLVAQPVLVLNSAGHLATPSRVAAALFRDKRVEEFPQISGAIFDASPDVLAKRIVAFLGDGETTTPSAVLSAQH